MNKNQKFFKELEKKLDLKTWKQDQNIGKQALKPDENTCCFGLRIAEKLCEHAGDYEEGEYKFYEALGKLGWDEDEIERTMRLCGATYYAFRGKPWVLPADQVFANLIARETPVSEKEFNEFFDAEGMDEDAIGKDGYNCYGY